MRLKNSLDGKCCRDGFVNKRLNPLILGVESFVSRLIMRRESFGLSFCYFSNFKKVRCIGQIALHCFRRDVIFMDNV